MRGEFTIILEEVEFLLSERRELLTRGPTLKIQESIQGNHVAMVSFIYHGKPFPLKLSPIARWLVSYLANRLPQTGGELEKASARHGDKMSTRSAKQYIRRVRVAIQDAFNEAGLRLDPNVVLVSERTESRQVLYRLKARIIREHGSYEEAH